MARDDDGIPAWFERFSAIPGINYERPPGLDLRKLKGYGQRPTIQRWSGMSPSLWWGSELHGSSSSPVHERAFGDLGGKSTHEVLENVTEALELPGTATDYHFAMQSAAQELWKRRNLEPEVLEQIERLCWLDIELLRAREEDFRREDEGEGERPFLYISAFEFLRSLYERDGALPEALAVAEIESHFISSTERVEEFRARIAAEAEE